MFKSAFRVGLRWNIIIYGLQQDLFFLIYLRKPFCGDYGRTIITLVSSANLSEYAFIYGLDISQELILDNLPQLS